MLRQIIDNLFTALQFAQESGVFKGAYSIGLMYAPASTKRVSISRLPCEAAAVSYGLSDVSSISDNSSGDIL